MGIKYNGKYLIPAPLVNISQEFVKNGEVIIGTTYRITLNGTFVADKGSPTSSGTWHTTAGYPANETIPHDERLKSIIAKQQVLRQLFSEQGKELSIEPLDGSTPLRCNPKIIGTDVAEGIWFDTANYTISLEAGVVSGLYAPSGESFYDFPLLEATEDWSVEMAEPQDHINPVTFRVSHNVSARGQLQYTSSGTLPYQPWQYASGWVMSRLGVDWQVVSGTNLPSGLGGYGAYNHIRSQTTDELGGSFGVSENWLLCKQNATEDFSVNTVTSVEDGITRVTIEGTVQGLDTRDTDFIMTESKWIAASGHFASIQPNLLTRAQSYAMVTLNPIVASTNIGRNPVLGTINYTYEYDSRPSVSCFGSGVLSANVTIDDKNANDVFALIPIPGRTIGPIIQKGEINTVTECARTINIDVVMTPPTGCGYNNWIAGKPNYNTITGIIVSAKPVPTTDTTVAVAENTESWNPQNGRYTRRVTFVWNSDTKEVF